MADPMDELERAERQHAKMESLEATQGHRTVNVYCGGRFVPLIQVGDWLQCTSCGRDLWEIGATFVVDASGLSSGHGYQDEVKGHDREAHPQAGDSGSAGAVQAGDA